MASKKKVVLYFTPGSDITEEQAAEMERIPGARQRNASLIDPDEKPEPCDAVAGPAIPDSYADKPVAVPLVAADEEEAEESDADEMTAAELKAALKDAGVDIPSGAKKADLVLLYQEHVGK